MIRLLCVDDDPIVRAYLAMRLGLEPDIRVAGVVASAGEALAFVRENAVDVLLVDYKLQGSDGMQLLGAVAAQGGAEDGPRVLFCTGLLDDEFDARAMAMGASGVVAKDRMAADLIPAVRAVAGGRAWFRSVPPA